MVAAYQGLNLAAPIITFNEFFYQIDHILIIFFLTNRINFHNIDFRRGGIKGDHAEESTTDAMGKTGLIFRILEIKGIVSNLKLVTGSFSNLIRVETYLIGKGKFL